MLRSVSCDDSDLSFPTKLSISQTNSCILIENPHRMFVSCEDYLFVILITHGEYG